jgi:hypothetical protein
VNLVRAADRLFESTLAPLVLGGTIAPGHALGARVAWSLGDVAAPTNRELAEQVRVARRKRARSLAPVDDVPELDGVDWALAAAFHDLLQAVNPTFDAPLRRYAAARILEVARAAIERAPAPARVSEALARHTWFARVLDVRRTDTAVSYWAGSRRYLGREPPARLTAWPELRRVSVAKERLDLLDLSPLAVDRERLTQTLAAFLERTPLTDLATCSRTAPRFVWGASTLALLDTEGGLRIALRALDRLPPGTADAALGRATRDVLNGPLRARTTRVVALLAERAVASIGASSPRDPSPPSADPDARFALGIGAIAARRALESGDAQLPAKERARIAGALGELAARAAASAP